MTMTAAALRSHMNACVDARSRGDTATCSRLAAEIRAATAGAERFDAADRRDDISNERRGSPPELAVRDRLDNAIAAVTDDEKLFAAAVTARQCDDSPFGGGGPAKASALRSELRGYLVANNTTRFRARALTVLEMHGCRFDGTTTPARNPGASRSSSYVDSQNPSAGVIWWPAGWDAYSARQLLSASGRNDATTAPMADVYQWLTTFLAALAATGTDPTAMSQQELNARAWIFAHPGSARTDGLSDAALEWREQWRNGLATTPYPDARGRFDSDERPSRGYALDRGPFGQPSERFDDAADIALKLGPFSRSIRTGGGR